VPPRPRLQKLGPEKLLLDILPKKETPARTPWWLTLLRLTLAALLIIAAAGPLWNPPLATSQASAPLALLIDDGWGRPAPGTSACAPPRISSRAPRPTIAASRSFRSPRSDATSRWRRRAPRACGCAS